MTEDFTGLRKVKVYLQLPLGIPGLFRKYDAPQALRIAKELMRSSLEGLLGKRLLCAIRWITIALWLVSGPALLSIAAWRAAQATSIFDYRTLWQIFALSLMGLSLSLHAIGRLTLSDKARSVYRPLATLPARAVLLACLWWPVWREISFTGSVLFAGCVIVLFLLIAPHVNQWLSLWAFQWGSPRKAGFAEAMAMPVMNEASIDRFAAHEAGHAIMYGLGEVIPEDLYLWIDTEVFGEDIGGAVCAVDELSPDRVTVEVLRFRLMVLAAGAAGELVHTGAMSLGSHLDFVSFEVIALPYMLAAGYAVYADAKSEQQHAVNVAAIAKLRAEMIDLARSVIEANREVQLELISQLKHRRELAYDDVLPTLAKITTVAGAPRPSWPDSIVTHPLRPGTRTDLYSQTSLSVITS
jgi:hypothetical protein